MSAEWSRQSRLNLCTQADSAYHHFPFSKRKEKGRSSFFSAPGNFHPNYPTGKKVGGNPHMCAKFWNLTLTLCGKWLNFILEKYKTAAFFLSHISSISSPSFYLGTQKKEAAKRGKEKGDLFPSSSLNGKTALLGSSGLLPINSDRSTRGERKGCSWKK